MSKILGWCIQCNRPIDFTPPGYCPQCGDYYSDEYDWIGKNELQALRDRVKELEAEVGKSIIEQRTIQKERDQAKKAEEFWIKQRAKDRAVNEQWVNEHSALLAELFGFEQEGCVEEKLFCVYERLINSQTRIKELEAELDSETKWAKTYCDAYVKVRDAANTYIKNWPSVSTHDLRQALKETENV